ncbi:hypothetical protein BsWGS_15390 [Bradybaena similaris]
MQILGYLLALVVVATASPPESETVDVSKRILGILEGGDGGLIGGILDNGIVGGLIGGEGGVLGGLIGGEGGVLGGLIGGEGGIVGGLLGGEGGLLTDLLGGDGGILGGILGIKADILTGLIKTVVSVLGGIIKSIVSVIQNLTKGLEGKTSEPEIYAEFRKYDLKQLCPVCPSLPNAQHVAACQKYCSEQGYKG